METGAHINRRGGRPGTYERRAEESRQASPLVEFVGCLELGRSRVVRFVLEQVATRRLEPTPVICGRYVGVGLGEPTEVPDGNGKKTGELRRTLGAWYLQGATLAPLVNI